MVEMFDVLDENGNKTGIIKNKKEVHEQGLWHAAVHIWIFNSKGEILLQKRSMKVLHWPGRWDISVAGHMPAGETAEQTAVREIEEEIGIKINVSDLKSLGIEKFIKHAPELNYHNKEIDYVYLFRFDGDVSEIKFLDGELDEVEFIPLEKFREEMNGPELHERYVPHERSYLIMIADAVEQELKKLK